MVVLLPRKYSNASLVRIARRNLRWVITSAIVLLVLFSMGFFAWDDITQFECLSRVNKRRISESPLKIVNAFSLDYYFQQANASMRISDNVDSLLTNWECVGMSELESSTPLKICIYDPFIDLLVSRNLKTRGFWERDNVAEMVKAFGLCPGMTLVDLGSNLGVFTLQAAAIGAEVIAVDALLSNHFLLHRSLVLNDLSCNVTLLHNAVHGRRQPMWISTNPSNIGASYVSNTPNTREWENSPRYSQRIDAICLDDLAPLVLGKDVFLKIDLEGSEEAVLNCSHEFFTQANVKVLMIEWMNYRHNERGSESIKNFLESHNMVPTWGVDRDRTIDLEASDSWPDNVFWMKT